MRHALGIRRKAVGPRPYGAQVTELPPFLRPFVLPHEPVEPVRRAGVDLYLPAGGPAPAAVLVHGGPVPAEWPWQPAAWSAFRGYGSLLARAGVVGVMLEHGFHGPGDLPAAAADVRRLVDAARSDPAVDGDRVALWFFSGGGPLAGEWLADPPAWLAAVALTYPQVDLPPDAGLVTPLQAVGGTRVPVLLTRVEHETPRLVPGQEALLAAGGPVQVHDVPGARHGFETLDDTDAARTAISAGVDWVTTRLRA